MKFLTCLSVFFFVFVCGCTSKNEPVDAHLGTVTRQDLVQRITISGPVAAKRRLDIRPSFAGYVQKIYVKIGDHVKINDPLVTFSPSLSKVETNYPVRATFNGEVTQVLKTEGEYVSDTGDQNLVMRVEDFTDLFVMATVPELDVSKVKIGQRAIVKVSSLVDESFPGEIREIGLSARDKDKWSSSSTEFQVKIALNTHDPRLLPGMSALCDVVTNHADKTLVLGHEFIQEDNQNHYFVTLAGGERRDIKLGLRTDEGVEVKDGLNEGEKVRVIDFLSLPKVMD